MTGMLMKKMIRDMKAAFAAYFLCILVLMLGLCGYSVLKLCYDNLALSRDLFFRQSDFCDGFVDTRDTEISAARRLSGIEGIRAAEGRLVQDIQMADSSVKGEAQLHVVSWEPGQMNRPVLSRGSMPGEGKPELVIGEGMAKARNLRPGDQIEVVVGGRRVPMKITGVGMTPENIYMVRDISEMFPDPSNYDAAFTSYETAAWLMGKENKANSFLIRLGDGVTWKDVEEPIRQQMEPYGFISSYAGTEQTGAAMLEEEIKQLDRMSGVVPLLFLTVAGVVLAITLSRMVEQQRTQIGTMMALGIPARKIRCHYMGYGAAIGAVGGLAGTVLGYLAADPMGDFYRIYFNLPSAVAPLKMNYLMTGGCASCLFCGTISWMIAGNSEKLEPARALHPAPPGNVRKSRLERMSGLMKLMTVPGIMGIRSLSRNRKRTVFSLIGMSVAYMLTATLVSMNTMFDVFIFDFWEKTQRQDVMVYFEHPVKAEDALGTMWHADVSDAEGVIEFPATLAGTAGKMDCSIQAVAQASEMFQLYRADGTEANVPEEGIILSEHMARNLGVSRGDYIELRVSYPQKKESRVVVSDIIAQYMGNTAYLSHEEAGRISDYRGVYTGVYLKLPGSAIEDLRSDMEGKGVISGIQSRKERLEQYRSMLGSMSGIMFSMSLMGVATGFTVVFVSSLIRYEELKRELATLMLLGMTSKECLDVLSVSQWILTAGAILLGIPLALGTSWLLSASMSSEMFTLPGMLNIGSAWNAIILTGISVWMGSLIMLRKLRTISPVAFLRERE